MRVRINWWGNCVSRRLHSPASPSGMIININATALVTCSCSWSPGGGGGRDVTELLTKHDFAHCMQMLVDGYYPEAEVIRLVADNLNTYTLAALYETFSPREAHRLLQRLEFHYTPKHGRWLNMVEIELSVLTGQCLKRRLPDKALVQQEIAAWERQRNATKATVQWRFTMEKARTKLRRLYPSQSVW